MVVLTIFNNLVTGSGYLYKNSAIMPRWLCYTVLNAVLILVIWLFAWVRLVSGRNALWYQAHRQKCILAIGTSLIPYRALSLSGI